MAHDSQTQLKDIMGCKNWVMLQIGRIAVLHADKLQALRQGHFNCVGFKQTIIDIHGFQQLGELDAVVSRAMIMLQLLPAVVAPLYVIGSVARQGDEQFFRDILSSPPLLDTSLKQRARILPALEDVWDKRRAEPTFLLETKLFLAIAEGNLT
ncbi:hypothetical protein VC83_02185 [Pseudogymnoascus destructans]|uniref:Uncharacterized protein n=2 Tax=Pseudogymnoascus destructans TaxID=655981 RepID=L8FVC6_PSED2|nr:uncharacterized protein VC83_02185 [Pseudogymnoascus destructans]ELR04433.1 hypothetical protein GMDG_01509 [Pseudogymnoascus destructans 20631-21]OAF61672.1 hypothetical protein VC83_02185 [Pseudogymnoascus destructans]